MLCDIGQAVSDFDIAKLNKIRAEGTQKSGAGKGIGALERQRKPLRQDGVDSSDAFQSVNPDTPPIELAVDVIYVTAR